MFSDMSAKDIIAIHKHDQEKEDIEIESSLPQQPATQFSTGIRLVRHINQYDYQLEIVLKMAHFRSNEHKSI